MMLKKAALLLVFVAMGFHIYLALHYYDLNYGMQTGESICNLSTKFNCDTVTASPFASLFSVPLAVWGFSTNLIFALLLVIWLLGWSSNTARLGRYTLLLSIFIMSMSIVMGTISIFLIGSYCLFCMGTYFISFATFELVRRSQEDRHDKVRNSSAYYLKQLAGPAKAYAFAFIAIPVLAFFFHRSYTMKIGAQNLTGIVNASVQEWQSSPAVQFSGVAPALSKGALQPKVVLNEFADFRCSHCQLASSGLRAFANSHPDVQLNFYVFPLDSTCNEAIPNGGGDGISCLLAKSVYCAEKSAQKGWALHDHLFSIQKIINETPSLEFAKEQIQLALTQLQISETAQNECINNPATDLAIREQAKLGDTVGVRGTPSLYVNNKKLSRGQLLPVLEAVYKAAKEME